MKTKFSTFLFLISLSLFEAQQNNEDVEGGFFNPCDQINLQDMETLGAMKNIRLGSELVGDTELPQCNNSNININIPEFFDAREEWPYCPSLWEVRDQGDCASCWATATASVMTDRYCIASKGVSQFRFSDQDLVSCGSVEASWDQEYVKGQSAKGCEGGNVLKAWQYVEKHGVVSGGAFNSLKGCMPYEFAPCKHSNDESIGLGTCKKDSVTPACVTQCNNLYKQEYDFDRRSVQSPCQVTAYSVPEIQTEIMLNGPVVAVIRLCNDLFAHNSTGVYRYTGAKCPMAHAVRIIGWGTYKAEDDSYTKYWLVVNSWNYFWGQEQGTVKILRGASAPKLNACIEKQVSAGRF